MITAERLTREEWDEIRVDQDWSEAEDFVSALFGALDEHAICLVCGRANAIERPDPRCPGCSPWPASTQPDKGEKA